ncbi:Ionotropic receptor 68a [Blattella germanica]|nr:Ionotropic receptor 68a [Blattella germanica]
MPILHDINCLAIINDDIHQDVFGGYFFKQLHLPYYKVLIQEKEDLQSPNFKTLSVIRQVKRSGCKVYILLISNGSKVARFLKFGDRYRVFDTRARFILLHDQQLFQTNLHYLWKKIVNVIFLRQHRSSYQPGVFSDKLVFPWYDISTVPFPMPIRKLLIPVRLDTWHEDSLFRKNAELFPDKTSNLKGENLRVVTFQHLPGSVKLAINNVRLDVKILNTLGRVMNFKPNVYQAEHADLEKWGRKQLNGSYTGLIGEVTSGKADVALGNLQYIPYYLELMDLTVPYTAECFTFLTPEALTDNSWMTLILPFKPVMWAAVIVAMALIGFVFYALANYEQYVIQFKPPSSRVILVKERQREDKTEPTEEKQTKTIQTAEKRVTGEGLYLFSELANGILYTYGMLLMVSLPKFPTGWSLRVMTGWWWLYCILLVVSYRASMTAILANPAPRITIDTLEQLVEADITCGGWGEDQKQFFVTSLDPAGQRIGFKYEVTQDVNDAVERIARGEFAFYDNIYFLQFLRIKRQVEQRKNQTSANATEKAEMKKLPQERNLHIMHDCIIHMPVSLGLLKNSPLKPHMDKYIRRIIEAGFIKKWLNDAILRVMSEEIKEDKDDVKALMKLEKLYGAIVALGIGYFISICCLIGELIYWESVVKKDPFYDKYDMRMYYKLKKTTKKQIRFK